MVRGKVYLPTSSLKSNNENISHNWRALYSSDNCKSSDSSSPWSGIIWVSKKLIKRQKIKKKWKLFNTSESNDKSQSKLVRLSLNTKSSSFWNTYINNANRIQSHSLTLSLVSNMCYRTIMHVTNMWQSRDTCLSGGTSLSLVTSSTTVSKVLTSSSSIMSSNRLIKTSSTTCGELSTSNLCNSCKKSPSRDMHQLLSRPETQDFLTCGLSSLKPSLRINRRCSMVRFLMEHFSERVRKATERTESFTSLVLAISAGRVFWVTQILRTAHFLTSKLESLSIDQSIPVVIGQSGSVGSWR